MNMTVTQLANSYEYALGRAVQVYIMISSDEEQYEKLEVAKKIVNFYDALANLYYSVSKYNSYGKDIQP